MQFLELLIFKLEEHDFQHLLLAIVAARVAMFEVAQSRDHYLLADCLENGLALQGVCVFDEVRHPSIIKGTKFRKPMP